MNAIGIAVKRLVPVTGPGIVEESARVISPFPNAPGWLSFLQDLDEDIANNTVCLMTAERSNRCVRLKGACRTLVVDITMMVREAANPILKLMTPENTKTGSCTIFVHCKNSQRCKIIACV